MKKSRLIFLIICNTVLYHYHFAQGITLTFGKEKTSNQFYSNTKSRGTDIEWINVNTATDTWSRRKDELVCTGKPSGVMRRNNHYENFLLLV